MKKIAFTIVMITIIIGNAQAQGVGGIFNQQGSKVQILLQQIAGLEAYLKTMKDGYKATENGLNNIHNLKNSSFGLHQNYFASLNAVSPSVKNNPKIQEIAVDQQHIIDAFNAELSWQKQQNILTSDEIAYLEKVNNNIITACGKDVDELNLVLSNSTQMADEERINRVDKIYAVTIDKYKFTRSFLHKTRAYAVDRKNGKQQTEDIKNLYNLN